MAVEYLLPSTTLKNESYEIIEKIGKGGFGITYQAKVLKDNKELGLSANDVVCIKEFFPERMVTRFTNTSTSVILKDDTTSEELRLKINAFKREAEILEKFKNLKHVVNIIENFDENDTSYIVMEYLEGTSLDKYVNSSMSVVDGLSLFEKMIPLIEDLGRIHKQGLIHRDISPKNIIEKSDGELVLIDFGIAREYDSTISTSDHTIGYTAPEQIVGGEQGPSTDVYGLAATIYGVLFKKPPVKRIDRKKHFTLQIDNKRLDSSFNKILTTSLNEEMGNRYQSMEDMRDAVNTAINRIRNRQKRIRTVLISACITLTAVVLGGVVSYIYAWNNVPEFRFRGRDTVMVYIEPSTNENYQIYKKRLNRLLGNDYMMKKYEENYTLIFPSEYCTKTNAALLIRQLVTRPSELYAAEYSYDEEGYAYFVKHEIKPEYIESVKFINSDEEDCLSITLSKEGSAAFSNKSSESEKTLNIIDPLNTIGSNGSVFYVYDAMSIFNYNNYYAEYDEDELNVIVHQSADAMEKLPILECLYDNLIDKSQPTITARVMDTIPATFELAKDAEHKGTYQIDSGDISESEAYITLRYLPYFAANGLSEGQYLSAFVEMKHRLDVLGADYAIGSDINDDSIVVKIKNDKQMPIEIFRLLGKKLPSVNIYTGDHRNIYCSIDSNYGDTFYFDNNKLIVELVKPNEDELEFLKKTYFSKDSSIYIYLEPNDLGNDIILKGYIKDLSGRMVFDRLCISDYEIIPASDEPLFMEYLEYLFRHPEFDNEYELVSSFTKDAYMYSFDNEDETRTIFNGVAPEILSAVECYFPDSTITQYSQRDFSVYVNEDDNTLEGIENSINKGFSLISDIDFMNSIVHSIAIEDENYSYRVQFYKFDGKLKFRLYSPNHSLTEEELLLLKENIVELYQNDWNLDID